MNKPIMFISFLIILFFILTACQQEPERIKSKNQENIPSSAKGITLQLEKERYTTGETETKLTLHNDDNETTFLYGGEYLLEKNVNGIWYSFPLKEGLFFSDEGHLLAPNETASEIISFEIFSEELSAGNYRIIKDFRDFEKEYSSENQVNIAAPFEFIKP